MGRYMAMKLATILVVLLLAATLCAQETVIPISSLTLITVGTASQLNAVNNVGVSAGNSSLGAFVRDAGGGITMFSTVSGYTLNPTEINDSGVIVGEAKLIASPHYIVPFVRDVGGAITLISMPTVGYTTVAEVAGIANDGTITGWYTDSLGYNGHGFVRSPLGVVTAADPPSSFVDTAHSVHYEHMRVGGISVGTYFDSSLVFYWFLRYADGTFSSIVSPYGSVTQNKTLDVTDSSVVLGETASGIYGDSYEVRLSWGGSPTLWIVPESISNYGTFPTQGASSGSCVSIGDYVDAFVSDAGYLHSSGSAYWIFENADTTATQPVAISDSNLVVGVYGSGATAQGFLYQLTGAGSCPAPPVSSTPKPHIFAWAGIGE
jgi:hypothetical protein